MTIFYHAYNIYNHDIGSKAYASYRKCAALLTLLQSKTIIALYMSDVASNRCEYTDFAKHCLFCEK